MRRTAITLSATLLCGATAYLSAETPKPSPATTTASTTSAPAKPKLSINQITQKQIDEITYEDSEEDTGFITPLAHDLDHMDDDSKKRLDDWTAKLHDWAGS